MKVLLHGATNSGSSNFGDFVYVDGLLQHLKAEHPTASIQLHQPSKFFEEHLAGYEEVGVNAYNADILVYSPGGYFGEGHDARFRDNLRQFVRFMPVGVLRALLRKPIVIVGIGAGPIKSAVLRSSIRFVGKAAIRITTRDSESRLALQELGVSNVEEAGDMILAMDLMRPAKFTPQVEAIRSRCGQRRLLFVHYNHSHEAMEKFARAVKQFVANRGSEFCVVVGSDQVLDSETEMFEQFRAIFGGECLFFSYTDAYEFIALLSISELVLTSKLHAGVVAAMLEKSVVCAAVHPEKTRRFYDQIGESARCTSLFDVTDDDILAQLRKFADSPITIPRDEINKAFRSWTVLGQVLESIDTEHSRSA